VAEFILGSFLLGGKKVARPCRKHYHIDIPAQLAQEVEMSLRTLCYLTALFVWVSLGTTGLRAQSAVESGILSGNSAGVAASAKPLVTFPKIQNPGQPSSSSATPSQGSAGAPSATPEATAKSNLLFFENHSGPDPGQIAVRTVPEHGMAWIDGKFIGSAPVNLKLAPGHHQVLVRSPNMHEATKDFEVTARQEQSLDFVLQPAKPSQVIVHWPSQK
jgi:PEGA domain